MVDRYLSPSFLLVISYIIAVNDQMWELIRDHTPW
jgi:hypothetical protein